MAITGENYTVESRTRDSDQELVDFFKRAYAGEYNSYDYRSDRAIFERIKWQNDTNPSMVPGGRTEWICRSRDSGRIAGHFAVMPAALKVGGSYIRAAWGRDFIVSPELRGTGAGTLLLNKAIADAKEEYGAILLAGVGDKSYGIFSKIGFRETGRIPAHVLILDADNVASCLVGNVIASKILAGGLKFFRSASAGRFRKEASTGGVSISPVSSFDGEFDGMWADNSQEFNVSVRRDRAFLDWRFTKCPAGGYSVFSARDFVSGKLRGYIALRRGLARGIHTGVITDIFARRDDGETIEALVEHAVGYFRSMRDIDMVRCDIMGRIFVPALTRLGFIRVPSSSRLMYLSSDESVSSLLSDEGNWFLTYADSDLDLSGTREEGL